MYSVAIAGSTDYTLMCAEALKKDARITISWVLTPSPKKIGRKQVLTKNPVHLWAEKHAIKVVLVDDKIDEKVQKQIEKVRTLPARLLKFDKESKNRKTTNLATVHFLLVVDFGYLIPEWLLELPSIAPLNIHPSDLPKYRGSSPAQFALLYGETESAVSVIIMNKKLDEGELVYQEKFELLNTWNTQEYYHFAFTLISKQLANIIADFAVKKILPKPQPLYSPTPIARRFNREDGYIEWEIIQAVSRKQEVERDFSSPLLAGVNTKIKNIPQLILNAVRALSPWPGVWTVVNTDKGKKRMKILSVAIKNGQLLLKDVQLEGLQPMSFEKVKNQLRS